MKTNFAVAAMLVLSVGGSVVVRAQQTSNGSSTPGATPAQPPPVVVKKEPVPSPDNGRWNQAMQPRVQRISAPQPFRRYPETLPLPLFRQKYLVRLTRSATLR